MLIAIDRRVHNNYAMQAGIHGIKIPLRYNAQALSKKAELEDLAFDPAQAERAMMEAQARVKARYV